MDVNSEVAFGDLPVASTPTHVELTHEGLVGNVRTSGICTRRMDHGFEAEIPAVLWVGEEVEAELVLPDSPNPMRASARVIYRNHNRYGFFFRSGPGTPVAGPRTRSRETVQ
jgi:hypothetical protein